MPPHYWPRVLLDAKHTGQQSKNRASSACSFSVHQRIGSVIWRKALVKMYCERPRDSPLRNRFGCPLAVWLGRPWLVFHRDGGECVCGAAQIWATRDDFSCEVPSGAAVAGYAAMRGVRAKHGSRAKLTILHLSHDDERAAATRALAGSLGARVVVRIRRRNRDLQRRLENFLPTT